MHRQKKAVAKQLRLMVQLVEILVFVTLEAIFSKEFLTLIA